MFNHANVQNLLFNIECEGTGSIMITQPSMIYSLPKA